MERETKPKTCSIRRWFPSVLGVPNPTKESFARPRLLFYSPASLKTQLVMYYLSISRSSSSWRDDLADSQLLITGSATRNHD